MLIDCALGVVHAVAQEYRLILLGSRWAGSVNVQWRSINSTPSSSYHRLDQQSISDPHADAFGKRCSRLLSLICVHAIKQHIEACRDKCTHCAYDQTCRNSRARACDIDAHRWYKMVTHRLYLSAAVHSGRVVSYSSCQSLLISPIAIVAPTLPALLVKMLSHPCAHACNNLPISMFWAASLGNREEAGTF
jgi:hypothetical protein